MKIAFLQNHLKPGIWLQLWKFVAAFHFFAGMDATDHSAGME